MMTNDQSPSWQSNSFEPSTEPYHLATNSALDAGMSHQINMTDFSSLSVTNVHVGQPSYQAAVGSLEAFIQHFPARIETPILHPSPALSRLSILSWENYPLQSPHGFDFLNSPARNGRVNIAIAQSSPVGDFSTPVMLSPQL